MKQDTVIKGKLWEGCLNKTKVYFPKEFYHQNDILKALESFDLKHVAFRLSFGKNHKGFDSYIVDFCNSPNDMIEQLLDKDNDKVRSNFMHWDKSDCGLIGLVEIYLRQLIDEHKEHNGAYYDTDYDEIVLRYE